MAAGAAEGELRAHACARLAVLHRRAGRYDEAAAAWQHVLDIARRRRADARPPRASHRGEALAMHHEHRARDLREARRYAEALREDASGRRAEAAAHRLGRLERKLRDAEAGEPGPDAGLLD